MHALKRPGEEAPGEPLAKRQDTNGPLKHVKSDEYATELDSDSDSLISAAVAAENILFSPDDVDQGEREELADNEALLLRRLQFIRELSSFYKDEYWKALQELQLRYMLFRKKEEDASTAAAESEAANTTGQPRVPLKDALQHIVLPGAASRGSQQTGAAVVNTMQQAPQRMPLESDGCNLADAMHTPTVDHGAPPRDSLATVLQASTTDEDTAAVARNAESACLPAFPLAEEFIIDAHHKEAWPGPALAPVTVEQIAANRQQTRGALQKLQRLEQAASAASARELDHKGALAMLHGCRMQFLIRRTAVVLGRSTDVSGPVDIDLSCGGDARKVSRQQARLTLANDGQGGCFMLQNVGRRTLVLNGKESSGSNVLWASTLGS